MVMNTERSGHCSAVIGSRLFVIGGVGLFYELNDIQSFDTSNLENTWQDHQFMYTTRSHHACQTETFDGQMGIYVTGGYAGQQVTHRVDFYVADLDRWDNVGYLKNARSYHTMLFIDGKMLVAGGYNDDYLQSVETFNGLEWEEIYDLTVARGQQAAVSFPAEMITC